MCSIAVISDVHSNIFGLERVLEDIKRREIEEIICLGDTVGYYPYPNECIELVKENCSEIILGNHDAGVIGREPEFYFNPKALKVVQWTRDRLETENLKWLKKLPIRRTIEREGKRIYLVHGSPFESFDYMYIHDDDYGSQKVRRAINHVGTNCLFVGHTHVPAIRKVENKLFLNPGSVGQPRNGTPGAFYAIVDIEAIEAKIIHLKYDFSELQEKTIEVGLPKELARRLKHGI